MSLHKKDTLIRAKCLVFEAIYKLADEKAHLNPAFQHGFYVDQREIDIMLDSKLRVERCTTSEETDYTRADLPSESPTAAPHPDCSTENIHTSSTAAAGPGVQMHSTTTDVQVEYNPTKIESNSTTDGRYTESNTVECRQCTYITDMHTNTSTADVPASTGTYTADVHTGSSTACICTHSTTGNEQMDYFSAGIVTTDTDAVRVFLPSSYSFYIYPGNHTPLERGFKLSIITGSILTFLHIGYIIRNYKAINFAAKWLIGSTQDFILYSSFHSLSAGVGLGLLVTIATGRLVEHVRRVRIKIGEVLASEGFTGYRDDGEWASATLNAQFALD
jgi:hypothetical protein